MIPVPPMAGLPQPGPSPSGVTSVVLVDDDADFRWVVLQYLERTGDFSVVGEAADGAAGVEVAAVLRPDVVLLDIGLPHLDGLDALSILRHRCPGSVVVMLTAMSSGAELDEALRGGAAGIIRKGSSMANMVAQLRGLVGLARSPRIVVEGVG
jgi:two-component system, NarL family, nitrate/nitrite response regulator NarL